MELRRSPVKPVLSPAVFPRCLLAGKEFTGQHAPAVPTCQPKKRLPASYGRALVLAVSGSIRSGTALTKNWAPTAVDFNSFIEWLDGGVASGGRSYVEMQARLIAYFARKGCTAPDDLADETLTRVARRLQEEGSITGVAPAQYCYIVARFVLLEYLRSADHARAELARDVRDPTRPDDSEEEHLLSRLDDCLAELDADDRMLILAYYSGDGPPRIAARRSLAATRRLTANALTIRASRIRDRLKTCLKG
jgi:RNA polymerase sigma factor (sigma-70 family)